MKLIESILFKILGTPHERKIKKLRSTVEQIKLQRDDYRNLDDTDLVAKTKEFQNRIKNGEDLENIKVEAFAVCQEACDRRLGILNILDDQFNFDLKQLGGELEKLTLDAKESIAQGIPVHTIMFPEKLYTKVREIYPESVYPFRMDSFDVQLIGGLILHEGRIGEMATGEGKTLAAACPVYLNALSGKGTHVVTVNDYLAARDAENMGRAYKFLGLSVGLIVNGLDFHTRKASYNADITYGTNNEFGFDYLRDNMATEKDEVVQRELNYCIVDEVDSVLIDEARTPLIISGPAEEATEKFQKANAIMSQLKKDVDFTVDEKNHSVLLTDQGVQTCQNILNIENLYGDVEAEWTHFIDKALSAHHLYARDVDYLVKENEVIIIDENTGRLMDGRRYSDGLHQALEAKEGVQIKRESQTLATITFQNFFRMYNKLSGMTGTADTEAAEFEKIYNLPVTVIPTNKPLIREDGSDLIFRTEKEKYDAIIAEITRRHNVGQPILVGTVSVEKSEIVAKLLTRAGIKHEVLNAKNHGREAEIIAFAGHKGRVTISTSMAGRGTDIKLGPGVVELGGLHVLATERHDSRRIDNQLRGRSGRQGDPGSSQYYLSLDDSLMRIFGGDRVKAIMNRLGAEEGEVITHSFVNRAIANAQKKVEGQNFEARKHLLDYDNVMNDQRTIVYQLRQQALRGEDLAQEIKNRLEEAVDIKVSQYIEPGSYQENWDLEALKIETKRFFNVNYDTSVENYKLTADDIMDDIIQKANEQYNQLEDLVAEEEIRGLERRILLMTIDQQWKNHLYAMDHLRESIRFQGYAQKDPLMVYKKEGFSMFESAMDNVSLNTITRLMNLQLRMGDQEVSLDQLAPMKKSIQATENTNEIKNQTNAPGTTSQNQPNKPPRNNTPIKRDAPKVGRNDPCWCGSGQKFKKCHGKNNG